MWIVPLLIILCFYLAGGFGVITGIVFSERVGWPKGRVRAYTRILLIWPYLIYKILTAKSNTSTMD